MIPIAFFVNAGFLWIILSFVARNQGDTSYSTLFYVSLGVTAAAFFVSICRPDLVIFIVPVVSVLAIKKFCYIGWIRAIVATVLYLVCLIAWSFFLGWLMHLGNPVQS